MNEEVLFGASNKRTGLDVYYINVKSMRKIMQFFVCFSESLNFNGTRTVNEPVRLLET